MVFSFKEEFQYMVALSLYFIAANLILKHLCFIYKYLFGKVLKPGVKVLFYLYCNFLQYVVRMMMAGTGAPCLAPEAYLCV